MPKSKKVDTEKKVDHDSEEESPVVGEESIDSAILEETFDEIDDYNDVDNI